MRRILRVVLAAVAGASSTTCRGAPAARASAPSHVDSLVPSEVALARFRIGLPVPHALEGGAASRDELVQMFSRALERRDTATLSRLMLTKAEFAFLYYPTNAQARPPYDLGPGLMWFMLETRSREGRERALEQRGGVPFHYAGYRCEGEPSYEGENIVWGPCWVRWLQARGDTVEARLFGLIVGRNGRYKFVSYANKL